MRAPLRFAWAHQSPQHDETYARIIVPECRRPLSRCFRFTLSEAAISNFSCAECAPTRLGPASHPSGDEATEAHGCARGWRTRRQTRVIDELANVTRPGAFKLT